MKSGLEKRFATLVKAFAPELVAPTAEFQAVPTRKYRWDFAYPSAHLLIEIQGGTWNAGAHGRGSGIELGCIKANLAAIAGYRVLYFTTSMLRKTPGQCVETLRAALQRCEV